MNILKIDDYLPLLSQFFGMPKTDMIDRYYKDLLHDHSFLESLNRSIFGIASFHGKQFEHVAELHAYRSLLYLFTRITKPDVFVETGVLNGFSSAFILLAMEHNQIGKLVSVDLPCTDPEILSQGTGELPVGKTTGWVVPDFLRHRHSLRLGPAQELLPKVFAEEQLVDVFLHDSDHCYTHMMFEMCLAFHFVRPSGWILSDNIEQNAAFYDLVRATGGRHLVVNSFLSPERTWQHGIIQKPKTAG
jgi:predicted O-methyltransferase YrrM